MFENRSNDRWNTITFLWAGLAPVKEVESFMGNCLSSDAASLAYGLLYDQYDRISPVMRDKMLKDLIHNDNNTLPMIFISGIKWIYSHPDYYPELPIPTIELRSLTEVLLNDLLIKAIERKDLNLNMILQTSSTYRDLTWMIYVNHPANLTEWIECILSSPPSNAEADAWRLWAIECSLRRYFLYNNKFDFIAIKETCTKYFPNLVGSIPLLLMSIIFELDKELQKNYNTLYKMLENIIMFPIDLITDNWFKASTYWIVYNNKADDLFNSFEIKLKNLRQNDNSFPEELFNSTLSFILNLKKLRGNLNDQQ